MFSKPNRDTVQQTEEDKVAPADKIKVHKSNILALKNNGIQTATLAVDGTLALTDPSRSFSVRAHDPFKAVAKKITLSESAVVTTAEDGSTFIFKFGKADKGHPV